MAAKLPQKIPIPQWKGRKVLVVEDDFISYKILEKYLSKAEAEVYWAKDGLEALEAAHRLHPDLALVDIRMPKLNGIDLTRKLRNLFSNLPIIIQTAYGLPEHQRECFEAGANAFLAKPFEINYFFWKISKFLS